MWSKDDVVRLLRDVSRDLRSGAIAKSEFDIGVTAQRRIDCGTVACIAGHMILRRMAELDKDPWEFGASRLNAWRIDDIVRAYYGASSIGQLTLHNTPLARRLFFNWMLTTPVAAADAIDEFIIEKETAHV